MDISSLNSISALSGVNVYGVGNVGNTGSAYFSTLTGMVSKESEPVEGSVFDAFLNTAIDNINTTNSYLSDAENEEIKFALGETENTHDLTIALQKASTALQYTVAVKNKLLEAYKEIMNMQI